MKIEQRQWKPQDLLADLQSIIDEEPDSYVNSRRVTLCQARDYLKEYFSLSSNDPLTLEDLREMDGEEIYTTKEGWIRCWGIGDGHFGPRIETGEGRGLSLIGYGKTWLAYRYKKDNQ